MYNLQIHKLRLKLRSATLQDDKIKIIKEAIAIADANNDIEWAFDFRLELITAEFRTSRCTESFPAFAWLLEACDNYPDLCDEKRVLWKYKWMLGSACDNSSISLEQINSMLEDFKVRLQRCGYSLRPYYGEVANLYITTGDWDAAQTNLELREKEPRDRMADCEACELNTWVNHYHRGDDTETALLKAADIFSGRFSCTHVPFSTYAHATYYMSKKADERAHDFFEKAEAEFMKTFVAKNNTSPIANFSRLIPYLAKNNPEKGWEFFEKYVHWSLDGEEYTYFIFAANLLPLLKQGGTRKLNVNSAMPWYNASNEYIIDDLYNYYYNQAHTLALKFDKRNGNSYMSGLLAEAVNL